MLHKMFPKSILKIKELETLEVIQVSEFFSSTYSCSFNTDMAVRMHSLLFFVL